MKIIVGSNGNTKDQCDEIIKYLEKKNYEIEDCRSERNNLSYVAECLKVSENVAMARADFGILICQKSIGSVIAANKVQNIRGVLVPSEESAKKARECYDANVLILDSAFITDINKMKSIVDVFLNEKFDDSYENINNLNFLSDYEVSCNIC